MLGEIIPSGYKRMTDSEVKPAWAAWAKKLNEQNYPGHYGEVFDTIIDGVAIAGIIEHHAYTVRGSERIPGNYHGVSLLWPTASKPTSLIPTPTTLTKTQRGPLDWLLVAATLTASSLAIYGFISARRRARAALEENALDSDLPYVLLAAPRRHYQPVQRGDLVKLVFRAEHSFEPNERMWVRVTGDGLGKLANKPVFLRRVRHGDAVTFERRHVAAVRSR